jgi:hypothetical protein
MGRTSWCLQENRRRSTAVTVRNRYRIEQQAGAMVLLMPQIASFIADAAEEAKIVAGEE